MPREIVPDDEWVPDEMLARLNMQRVVEAELTDEELARKILMQAAPGAAQSVAWLSSYAGNENVRLSAAKYIIDGVIGGGFKVTGGADDLLIALVNKLADNDAERSDAGMPQRGA
jgi:hypothetical protein